MRTAGIYCRISDDREGAGLGVARQEEDCRVLAKGLGLTVARVYVDNDLSAYSGLPRSAYKELLTAMQAGQIQAVLAWHTDRLHRSPRELEEFIDICERSSILIQTVRAGPLDLSTPAGRAVARTLGAWARYESEHKAERNRRKALELAQRGEVSGGGTRPYGYAADGRTTITEEAAIIREMADRVLLGEPLYRLAIELNERRVPTVTGKPWHIYTLMRILCS